MHITRGVNLALSPWASPGPLFIKPQMMGPKKKLQPPKPPL